MKIKVVLAEKDECYIRHFDKAMKMFYSKDVEVIAFSKEDSLKRYMEQNTFDILLKSEMFPEVEARRAIKAVLTDAKGIKEIEGATAICKYQRIDQIYKELVNIFAEERTGVIYEEKEATDTPIIAFSSATGGVGKTTSAILYARKMAMAGYQVLYLPLEELSTLDLYFNESGDATLSNLLFSIKCGKGNLQLKLDNALRQVYGGLYYLAPAKSTGEVQEMKKDEWNELFQSAKGLGKFHCIIVDLPNMMNDMTQDIIELADRIALVMESRDVVAAKTQLMLDWAYRLGEEKEQKLKKSMVAIQNKTVSGKREFGVPIVALLPYVPNLSEKEVVDSLTTDMRANDILKVYTPGGDSNV